MVCLPCIVIPLLLWIFHKFIQPFLIKYWNPWGKKELVKITEPPEGVSKDDLQFQHILNQTRENPVIMFSKTTCSFCNMAKEVLDGLNVEYIVEEINQREDCDALQAMFAKITGEKTVPRVFIGGVCVGGGSDVWTLKNENKLLPMLKEAGATFKEGEKKEN